MNLTVPVPTFRTANILVNGKNSAIALKGIHSGRVAIITGTSLDKNHIDRIIKLINHDDVLMVKRDWIFEPAIDGLKSGMEEIEKFRPDLIVAIGGGSVIDGAKLLWLFYEHPDLSLERNISPMSVPPLRGKCKFAVIPTTAGSGSEVSSAAIIYHRESKRKIALISHDFIPDLVILDPEFLRSIPTNILLSTVCDALSHAIEGYVSPISNPLIENFAEKCVQIVSNNWEKAVNESDAHSLNQLLIASTMAGWVQNHCLVGLAHAIAHQLTQYYVPHAIANAILLPEVIKHNAESDKNTELKYRTLAKNSGLKESYHALIDLINDITHHAVIPRSLSKYNVILTDGLMLNILDDPLVQSNPVKIECDDVKKILSYLI